jgi:hypothetical protein
MQQRITVLGVVLGASLLLGACVDKFTAGGTLPAQQGAGVANFGLVINLEKDHASGTYRDHATDVAFRIVGIEEEVEAIFGCIDVVLEYVSTNPARRGEGEVRLFACDRGEPGKLAGDEFSIQVLSGPYAGYTNGGEIRSGNLQAHD